MIRIKNYVQKNRKTKKLTQEQLAQAVGVSRKTIVSLERGNYIPSLLLAFKLSEVLEVDINKLFEMVSDT